MDLPIILIKPLIEQLGQPFLIIMLVIIWWQFRSIDHKDKVIQGFHSEVKTCGVSLAELTKMVEVLVYGRNNNR